MTRLFFASRIREPGGDTLPGEPVLIFLRRGRRVILTYLLYQRRRR